MEDAGIIEFFLRLVGQFALMLVPFFTAVIIACLLGQWNHSRLLAEVRLHDNELDDYRAGLLAVVAQASNNQRTRVNLQDYWSRTGLRAGERFVVIRPLLESGAFYLPPELSAGRGPVTSCYYSGIAYAFCATPEVVVLSDREWTRMVHEGVSAHVIVERLTQMNQHIFSGGGDVNAVAAAGNVSDNSQRIAKTDAGNQLRMLRELHATLMHDASGAPSHDAERLRGLASEVQDELDSKQPMEGRFRRVTQRVRGATDYLGSTMTSTAQLFKSWDNLGLGG